MRSLVCSSRREGDQHDERLLPSTSKNQTMPLASGGIRGSRVRKVATIREPGGNVMAATDILSGPLSYSEHRAQLRKAVIASTVGTTIE
jgi:hypothetical protein